MSSEKTNGKMMTVKEMSVALGVSESSIKRVIENLRSVLGAVFKNRQGGYLLNESQVTAIKQELQKHHNLPAQENLSNITTEIEMAQKTMEVIQYFSDRVKSLQSQNEAQATQLIEQAPKVEIYNKFLNSKGNYSMGDVAKHIGIGRNKLFDILRQRHILNANNIPYQCYMSHFEVKTVVKNDKSYKVTYVTPKGMVWIQKKIATNIESMELYETRKINGGV